MAEIRQLSVRPLTANRIAQAYPLAQLSLRNCSPEAWDAYARRHLDRDAPSGVLAVEDDKGTIFGLSVYQIAERADEGRCFQAKTVIVTDPFACGRIDVATLLIEAEERDAAERDCARVEVFLPRERGPRETNWWTVLLSERGYSGAGTHFFKRLGDRQAA